MAKGEFRNAAVMIAPLYFLLGAFSLVFQTILLREFFTVAAGNEISFGIALGSWLLGVGAGSFWAGANNARPGHGAHALPRVVMFLCVSAPLLLVGVRCLQQISGAPRGALIPLATTFWLIPLFTVPFSFFSGFAFPLAVKLGPGSALNDAQKLIRAYIWECLGALAGGVIYTYWLLEVFNPALIISLFTLPLLLTSLVIVGREKRKKALAVQLALLAFNLYAILSGAGKLDSWLVQQRWQRLSAATWVESLDSRYQNLQLGFSHGQYCLFSNGQLTTVFPDDDGQKILAAQIITQHPRPQRVLVIGEGASGLAQHLLRYKISSLTAVEMDGEFLDLIVRHLPGEMINSLSDPRLSMPVLDGRRFIMEAARAKADAGNRFDLVYLHQPDAWTAQLNRYYTREFFLALKAVLGSGGVAAMRLTSAENYASEISNPYTASIYQTLQSVFPAIAVSPGPSNFFSAAAAIGIVSTSPAILAERYRRLVQPPAELAMIFGSLYPQEKTRFIQKALAGVPRLAQNRDQRPSAYFFCSRLLGWTSGSPLTGFFDFFENVRFRSLLLCLILLLSLTVLWVVLRRRRAPGNIPALLAAANGGFAGLSFEILTIFAFQNIWGYVYRALGMLIAVFMLGMGVGAALAARTLKQKQPLRKTALKMLAADQLLIAFASLTCLPLLAWFAGMAKWSGQAALFSWLGGIGFLVGAVLPLALYSGGRETAAKKAGQLNAADYLGGSIGAMAMAALFLPLYGTADSLLLIAVPALAAALLLWLEGRFNDPGPA